MTFMKSNPSWTEGDRLPVDSPTWNDAMAFCRRLTESCHQAEILPARLKCDLPTEAQWEYACRAGSSTKFSFGDDDEKLKDYGWYADNSGDDYHRGGLKLPNAWGLYDMHGNVWEWCRDVCEDGAPDGVDPVRTSSARITQRVIRGGCCCSWHFGADVDGCRSANRIWSWSDIPWPWLGIRLVLIPG